MTRPRSVHLLSDFNVDILRASLARLLDGDYTVTAAPFGQVRQGLSSPSPAIDTHTAVVVWTRPEAVIEQFAHVAALERTDHDRVLDEVEAFKRSLVTLAGRCRYVFVPTWTVPPDQRLFGILDFKPGAGVRHLLARMNLSLSALMDTTSNLVVLPADPWLHAAHGTPYAPKLDFITKTPFAREVFDRAAHDVRAALRGLEGLARKVVVVDLDDTLWGGIVGDDGWEHLRLGGHDHVGEAYVRFQRALLALRNRGIQLAIASKNDEAVALEAMTRHPEMVLRPEHFAGWRINWNDKAQNLVELADELRLGLQSFVFIDDNPVERDRVAHALPDVFVPDWPVDPAFLAQALERLDCFDVGQLTAEDFARSAQQSAERLRRAELAEGQSHTEWLGGLRTAVVVETLSTANLSRVTQLFNKTNQLNLQTRRLSADEIQSWLAPPNRRLWAVRVRDKFGDLGLTGVISLELQGDVAWVTDLILSCRVMGRRVEDVMLNIASRCALDHHAERLRLEYRASTRNAPCLAMLEASRLTRVSDHVFEWNQKQPYALPETVTLS